MATSFLYKRIFSGIQPSGRTHIGNYLGALKQWTHTQEQAEQSFFCIVDMHALTVPKKASVLRENVREMACVLLACGLNPKKCSLFQQSRVSEHAELSWVLTCHASMAQLRHLPHLKEKNVDVNPPMGFLSYPVLQAADILLYKSTHVPVGEDQLPHLYLTRDLASAFNQVHDVDIFVEPKIITSQACRVRDLKDPEHKMSKSSQKDLACLYMDDTDDEIIAKIKGATTDPNAINMEFALNERPGISNLIQLYSEFGDVSTDEVIAQYTGKGTGPFKKALGALVAEKVRPIRSELLRLRADPEFVESVLDQGAEEARQVASSTWQDVKRVVGFS